MKYIGRSKKSYNRYQTILDDFKERYQEKYDYTESEYSSFKEPISVKCNIENHGSFKVTPQKHLNGQGCPLCSQIERYGHISISQENLKNHHSLLIKTLQEKHPNLIFDNFTMNDDGYTFDCPEHGKITDDKIVCKKCQSRNDENNKLQTITKRLELYKKTNPSYHIIEQNIQYNNIKLVCEHGEFIYTNGEIYNGNVKCKECRYADGHPNQISEEEFIKNVIQRLGEEYAQKYNINGLRYIDARTKVHLHCEDHGPFELYPSNLLKGHNCPKCSQPRSNAESEISELFVKSGFDVLLNDRSFIKPKEVDILSHENRLGIEYDGILWHSFGKSQYKSMDNFSNEKTGKSNHIIKTQLVESKGYQLFHIFENEWLDEYLQKIWKSMIRNKLKQNTKIYARKCQISEVSNQEYKRFTKTNHLQGFCAAKIKIGLYYDGELVSLMSFGKSRYAKEAEYELIRFCTKINVNVVGGASKLLKYFEYNYNPSSVVSFANKRWSKGDVYEKLGFKHIIDTPPNYFYFKLGDNILYSRVQFQKHKLKDKLETFDESLSETENMYNNGYRKIYDCGNKKYLKKYK